MDLEELVLHPAPLLSTPLHSSPLRSTLLHSAPLRSTGAACAQGRPPRATRGTVRCVGVCLGLRVCVRQCRLRRFFRCLRLLPGPLTFDPRLLPSPPGYPCARPSYCLLAQFQNRPRHNKLRDRVLPPEDRGPNPNDP